MLEPIEFQTPDRPEPHEPLNYVSARSLDPTARHAVSQLFFAFDARYDGDDPLEAFLEWIVVQLQAVPREGEILSLILAGASPEKPTMT